MFDVCIVTSYHLYITCYRLLNHAHAVKTEAIMVHRNVVRRRRQSLGLSMTQLACRIGMAQSTLSNIELGKWPAWPKARRDLAQALDTPESDLFPRPKRRKGATD